MAMAAISAASSTSTVRVFRNIFYLLHGRTLSYTVVHDPARSGAAPLVSTGSAIAYSLRSDLRTGEFRGVIEERSITR
jgi:hypothetical protein